MPAQHFVALMAAMEIVLFDVQLMSGNDFSHKPNSRSFSRRSWIISSTTKRRSCAYQPRSHALWSLHLRFFNTTNSSKIPATVPGMPSGKHVALRGEHCNPTFGQVASKAVHDVSKRVLWQSQSPAAQASATQSKNEIAAPQLHSETTQEH